MRSPEIVRHLQPILALEGAVRTVIPADVYRLRQTLDQIGLSLSVAEVYQLYENQILALDNLSLGSAGTVFILVSANNAKALDAESPEMRFADLLKLDPQDGHQCIGVPLYCWITDSQRQRCVYLALSKSKLILQIGYYLDNVR